MKKRFVLLLGGALVVLLGSSQFVLSEIKDLPQIKGLPASDVLGSEDIWDNATFVGGGPNGGATAHSEF